MTIKDPKSHAIALHDKQAGEFDDRYVQMQRDIYCSTFTYGRAKVEDIIERALAGLPKGAKILDAGCGTGFNVSQLSAKGFTVTGIEPAEDMRRRAKAANPKATIIDGDIENLPFEDNSFDALLSIEVIRYFPDPSRALAECLRVLKPGGVAVISVAPLLSLNGYALINVVTSRFKVPGLNHVRQSFMTAGGGSRALRKAGFKQVEVHGAFVGPWHVLQRVAPKAASFLMRKLEPVDDKISDLPVMRDLSNHLVLIGRK